MCSDCSCVVIDSIDKANEVINNPKYNIVVVSISGGADSDDVLDLCYRLDVDKKCRYVWYDIGLEYQATKDHLTYLEQKYNIKIIRKRAIKPIPVSCREFGQPFVNKRVSDYIARLQKYNFGFEDEPFDALLKRYPRCKSALKWWCNRWGKSGENSQFNISQNSYLKEFLILTPPKFKISKKCCDFAKKYVAHSVINENNADLNIFGVRKSEGGVRATAFKTCFNEGDGVDSFRPIWWWDDSDKVDYEQSLGIVHSDCYTRYGLRRTGCVGCPFARNLQEELDVVKVYEPKLYNAINFVFKDSYEYTKKYRDFCKEMRSKGIKPRKD